MRAWCWRTEASRGIGWIEAQSRVPAAFARVLLEMRGARSAGPSIRISGKVKTTRRSSLGDFGHSRLALRREGSDRHRGCYPTDPTGEGCPSFRRDRFPPSLRAEFSCPGGRCSIRPRRAGLPLSAGADENPPPAKPEGLTPRPTLPVTLSGSIGERPSPSRLKALSD